MTLFQERLCLYAEAKKFLKNTTLDGKQYRPYQIAYLLMTGCIPQVIDHIDGNRENNKWANLREVTYAQNSANMRKKGVYQNKQGKWYFQVCYLGRRYYYSGFTTEEEALLAHQTFCESIQGEYAYHISRNERR